MTFDILDSPFNNCFESQQSIDDVKKELSSLLFFESCAFLCPCVRSSHWMLAVYFTSRLSFSLAATYYLTNAKTQALVQEDNSYLNIYPRAEELDF